MEFHPPITVALNAAHRYGRTAWGIATSREEYLAAQIDTDDISAAFLEGFAVIVKDPRFAGLPIDLYCPDRFFVNVATEMAHAFPNITIHPCTENTRNGPQVRAAYKAAHDAIRMPNGTDVADPDTSARLVAATDGSAGNRNRPGQRAKSGWAWITNTGLHGYGTITGSSVLAAEITAIKQLLSATSSNVALTVYCDSRDAIRVVSKLATGEAEASEFTFAGHRQIAATLRQIPAMTKGRDLELLWVPGHSGHPLNDGADRLAVYARRVAQSELGHDVGKEVALRIVQDTLADLERHAA